MEMCLSVLESKFNAPSTVTENVHKCFFENINMFKVTVLESAATDFVSITFKIVCKNLNKQSKCALYGHIEMVLVWDKMLK